MSLAWERGWMGVVLLVAPFLASRLAVAAPPAQVQPPATEAPRVTSAAELTLVNVEVVVTGKDGSPVEGLTARDFVVLHGGKPVTITNFREERQASKPPAESPAPAVAPPPEPGMTSASPVVSGRVRRHLLFFVDDLALPEARERETVFGALRSILERSFQSGDDAMIVTWRRGIRRAFPFTGDLALLGRRLDVVARDAGRLGAETQTEIDNLEADDAFYRWIGGYSNSELSRTLRIQERWAEVKAKLTTLKGLAASMAGMEGRKAIVLVSRRLSKSAGAEYEYSVQSREDARRGLPISSVPIAGVNAKPFIDSLTETANAAGVTIHSLYAEAWSADGPGVAPRDAPRRLESFSALSSSQQAWMNEMSTLGALSEKTGGIAVGNTTQAPLFAERVATDLTHWYSIGYPRPAGSGGSDRISASVTRPGVEVRSRREFVERPRDDVMRERVLASLFRRDEAARLPIAVTSGPPAREKKGRYRTPVLVRVPVRSLALLPNGPDLQGAVSIYSVSASPGGEVTEVRRARHEVKVPAGSAGPASTVVLSFEMEVEAPDPAARISICVQDETSLDAGFRLIRPGS